MPIDPYNKREKKVQSSSKFKTGGRRPQDHYSKYEN